MVDVLKVVIAGKDDFSKTFKNFRMNLDANVMKAVAAAGAAVTAYTAATYASVKATAEAYDSVGKFAGRIGISTEALSKYNHVAELSGISTQTLNMGFQRMTRRIAEAAQGTGVAKNALLELGISIKDIRSLSPDKQFETIAKAMDGLGSQSDKVRLAMQFFDSEGVALIQTLSGGSKGLEEMKAEAEKFGLVISSKAAANAAAFNDSLTRSQGALKGLRNAFSEDLMPMITGLQNAFANFVADNRKQIVEFVKNFSSRMLEFAEKGAYAVGILIDSWRGLKMLFEVLKLALNSFVELFAKGLAFLSDKAVGFMEKFNIGGVFDTAIEKAKGFQSFFSDWASITSEQANMAKESLMAIAEEGFATSKIPVYVEKMKSFFETMREQGDMAIENNAKVNESFQETATQQIEGWDLVNYKIAEWITTVKTWNEAVAEILTSTFDMIASGIGDSIASAIIDGENLMEGLKNLMKNVAKSIISTLVQIGIQRLITSLLFKSASIAEHVSRIGQLAAQTYSGAFAATAAIPIIGPPLAPSVAAASTATMLMGQKAANISGVAAALEEGGPVYAGRSYLVGERGPEIYTASQRGEIIPNDKMGGGSIGNINIQVLPNATNIEAMHQISLSDWMQLVEDKILPAMRTLAGAGITA